MSAPTSPLRTAWYRWKSLKLPWRKRFLVGLDLQGNTFWEFRDTLSSHKHRMRRIVQYPSSTHYSEIKISPQWHQWLRHTRSNPPSLTEQSQDVIRQQNLKVLAAEADARWAAKPSLLDSPGQARGQPLPAMEVNDPGGYATSTEPENRIGVRSAIGGAPEDVVQRTGIPVEDEGKEGHKRKMQVPDGIRHRFNEKVRQEKSSKTGGKKEKEDPWKQSRGGPSEDWQPEPWSGNLAARR